MVAMNAAEQLRWKTLRVAALAEKPTKSCIKKRSAFSFMFMPFFFCFLVLYYSEWYCRNERNCYARQFLKWASNGIAHRYCCLSRTFVVAVFIIIIIKRVFITWIIWRKRGYTTWVESVQTHLHKKKQKTSTNKMIESNSHMTANKLYCICIELSNPANLNQRVDVIVRWHFCCCLFNTMYHHRTTTKPSGLK